MTRSDVLFLLAVVGFLMFVLAVTVGLWYLPFPWTGW